MAKKRPTGKKDKKGRPIFEGDHLMTGSPPKFIPVEWQEVPCSDDELGSGVMCGFFIPDDAELLITEGHPGYDEPSKS